MGGFANHSAKHGYNAMWAFNSSQLPVKIALAKEFALFNNFYAAIPGPSQPNHMFAQSGTSCGVTETGVVWNHCGGKWPLFPQKTIYDSLNESGKE
jgi:phospholipase C